MQYVMEVIMDITFKQIRTSKLYSLLRGHDYE